MSLLHRDIYYKYALRTYRAEELLDLFLKRKKEESEQDMWKGRAISLFLSGMTAFVFLRDNQKNQIHHENIYQLFSLEHLEGLFCEDLPSSVLHPIQSYLRSIPGYKPNTPKQSQSVLDIYMYSQINIRHFFDV